MLLYIPVEEHATKEETNYQVRSVGTYIKVGGGGGGSHKFY